MLFFPDSPQQWDADDYRYVRNAVLIGCAVALFTEVVRGGVDVIKDRVKERLAKKAEENQ